MSAFESVRTTTGHRVERRGTSGTSFLCGRCVFLTTSIAKAPPVHEIRSEESPKSFTGTASPRGTDSVLVKVGKRVKSLWMRFNNIFLHLFPKNKESGSGTDDSENCQRHLRFCPKHFRLVPSRQQPFVRRISPFLIRRVIKISPFSDPCAHPDIVGPAPR